VAADDVVAGLDGCRRGWVADLIDACAAASTAIRVARREAVLFPDPPERDAFGLPIAIWA
jgi:predicted RNase H-like nuclease